MDKGYPDTHSKLRTFIKIGLFGKVLAEWRKVVFLDSDMLPVENIDALFDVPHRLAMVSTGGHQLLNPLAPQRDGERGTIQHPTSVHSLAPLKKILVSAFPDLFSGGKLIGAFVSERGGRL